MEHFFYSMYKSTLIEGGYSELRAECVVAIFKVTGGEAIANFFCSPFKMICVGLILLLIILHCCCCKKRRKPNTITIVHHNSKIDNQI